MILGIVQARLGSTRLPQKVLRLIDGVPVIVRVLEQVRQVPSLGAVVLAVPSADVPSMPTGPWSVLGPVVDEADVLGRFAAVADCYPTATAIMRVTGDCPFLSPDIALAVVETFAVGRVPYASNLHWPTYVDGEDVEVFSVELLQRAHAAATDPYDREHVTPWMRRVVAAPAPYPTSHKTSIDTHEDFERAAWTIRRA